MVKHDVEAQNVESVSLPAPPPLVPKLRLAPLHQWKGVFLDQKTVVKSQEKRGCDVRATSNREASCFQPPHRSSLNSVWHPCIREVEFFDNRKRLVFNDDFF